MYISVLAKDRMQKLFGGWHCFLLWTRWMEMLCILTIPKRGEERCGQELLDRCWTVLVLHAIVMLDYLHISDFKA
jgi:hypothetical protein